MPDRPRDPRDAAKADPPWIFRTYAGHSSTRASNELFRGNLAAGQTGLEPAAIAQTAADEDVDLIGCRSCRARTSS